MPRIRPFQQVDVFTPVAYRGNPLAVVLDGEGLDEHQMQAFTSWTNLSEATFLLPPTDPQADYRVRIFCPFGELPFAGHPTLGSAHAWLRAGGKPRGEHIIQQCGVGLVPIRREGSRLAFGAPPLRRQGALDDPLVEKIAQGLGVDRRDILAHGWCDNGPGWCAVMLRDAAQVLSVKPDASVLGQFKLGLIGAYPTGEECQYEVRAFFPGAQGLSEDPVTGSLNAALALWLIGAGLLPDSYLASQGTALGRAGRVHVQRDAGATVWVGGDSITCVEGSVTL